MEWDFTIEDVSLGKVEYGLEEFLADLRNEIVFNFEKFTDKQVDHLLHLFYCVMYFTLNRTPRKEIVKKFKIDEEFLDVILDMNKENKDMLQAIIMNMFLDNLKRNGGLLHDVGNHQLVNAKLHLFHKKHDL